MLGWTPSGSEMKGKEKKQVKAKEEMRERQEMKFLGKDAVSEEDLAPGATHRAPLGMMLACACRLTLSQAVHVTFSPLGPVRLSSLFGLTVGSLSLHSCPDPGFTPACTHSGLHLVLYAPSPVCTRSGLQSLRVKFTSVCTLPGLHSLLVVVASCHTQSD